MQLQLCTVVSTRLIFVREKTVIFFKIVFDEAQDYKAPFSTIFVIMYVVCTSMLLFISTTVVLVQ